MIIHYFGTDGCVVGDGESASVPENATEIAPNTMRDIWNGTSWVTPPKSDQEVADEIYLRIESELENLVVTTTNGNTFDANNQARLDMQNGITLSSATGQTETYWRLADNSEVLITVQELVEALGLALQAYANTKGITA